MSINLIGTTGNALLLRVLKPKKRSAFEKEGEIFWLYLTIELLYCFQNLYAKRGALWAACQTTILQRKLMPIFGSE